jgi:hypothetical protein
VNRSLHLAAAVTLFAFAHVASAGPLLSDTVKPGFSAEFVLQDQHAADQKIQFPRAKISVLIVADQKGSEQIAPWVTPLYARYEKRIDIAGLASLPGIPSPFHGLFRREFRKKLAYPVLLDWTGEVSKTFNAKPNVANLFVIGKDGKILVNKTGAVAPAELKDVTDTIDAGLK